MLLVRYLCKTQRSLHGKRVREMLRLTEGVASPFFVLHDLIRTDEIW